MNNLDRKEIMESSIRALECQLEGIEKITNQLYKTIIHYEKLLYGYRTDDWDVHKWRKAMLDRRERIMADIEIGIDINENLEEYQKERFKKMLWLCTNKQEIDFLENCIRRSEDD